MILDLIQKYKTFISALILNKCCVNHYIIYRKNKIQNISFSDVVQMPMHLPQNVPFKKILIENDKDKYTSYKNNAHHWTTQYCWENFIPLLMRDLNVKFDQSAFVKIPYLWNTCDFSYHNNKIAKFKIKPFGKNEEIGEHEILRNTNNCPFMILSCYHSLFKLAHCSGTIVNLNNALLQRVAINCDSMAIPIIPILACFCKNILVIDNRSGKNLNYMKIIVDFKPTHYISLFTEENFLFNHKHIAQII